jgi:hypothetical protein
MKAGFITSRALEQKVGLMVTADFSLFPLCARHAWLAGADIS